MCLVFVVIFHSFIVRFGFNLFQCLCACDVLTELHNCLKWAAIPMRRCQESLRNCERTAWEMFKCFAQKKKMLKTFNWLGVQPHYNDQLNAPQETLIKMWHRNVVKSLSSPMESRLGSNLNEMNVSMDEQHFWDRLSSDRLKLEMIFSSILWK